LLTTNFLVVATLDFPGGRKLMLANSRILFDNRPAEPAAARALLNKLNPVVDFASDLGLADAITLKSITLRDGILEARGDTKIPVKPS
jgi:hypothetical protein